ncbi:MAG: hypothetical protein HKN26_14665 [Acidimicrobiales bacterium]|nr:hypothetical protein [Acidimicrobiales bacterium]
MLADHIELRLEALGRHELFLPSDDAAEKVAALLEPLYTDGTVEQYPARRRPDAVVAWRHQEESFFGPPVTSIAIDSRLGVDVERWLEHTLAAAMPDFEPEWDLLLDRSYHQARRALLSVGAGIDSVIQLGEVDAARRRFRSAALPAGFTIAPMEPDQIDAVVGIYADAFAAEPQYCWFGADPRFLESQARRFTDALAAPDHLELVVSEGARIVAHAGATIAVDHPFWGPTGGMSLCFSPSARGRGLLRGVYTSLLAGLAERGARAFRGGTSQPAVMKYSREMGRTLEAIVMRPGAFFEPDHFAPVLAEP